MAFVRVRKILLFVLLLTLIPACDQRSKESLLVEARHLSAAGNYRGAIVLARNALERDGNYFEARYVLAKAYLQAGQYASAERECEKIRRQAPQLAELPLLLADLYNHSGRPDQAIAEIEQDLKSHPSRPESYNLLGRAQVLKEDISRAEESFHKALALDPANDTARLELAKVLLQRKDEAGAGALLQELAARSTPPAEALYLLAEREATRGNLDGALEYYQRLQKLNPEDPRASYLMGVLLLEQGRVTEGERQALRLTEKYPQQPAGFLLAGMSHYLQRDYTEAAVDLQTAINKRADLSAHYFLGLSYYALDRLELALNQFQRILDQQPSFLKARALVALILLKQNRLEDAAIEVDRLLAADPDNGLGHDILGSIHLARNELDAAMKELDRAIELDPGLVDARLRKGIFQLEKGDPKLGEQELVTVLKTAPEILNIRLLLGTHYIKQQNFAGAIATLQEGLTGNPSDALIYNLLAAAYFNQGQAEQALAALAKAQQARPDYAAPYLNLAAYRESRGEYPAAIEQYQQLLAVAPDNLQALLNIAALQELQGQDAAAAASYQRAGQGKTVAGAVAYVRYLARQKRMKQALQTLDRALIQHPKESGLLALKGRILADRGLLAEAAAVFTDLERAHPGLGVPLLIRTYLDSGDVAKARQVCNQLIEQQPRSAAGYALLSQVYLHQNDRPQAEQVLRQGIDAAEGPASLQLRLGGLLETDRPEQAEQIYRRLQEQQPQYYPATFALGALYDRLGNKREAVDLYQQVLARQPNYTPALNNLAFLLVENYHQAQKGLQLAHQAYRNDPADPRIIDTLGFVLLHNGRPQQAQLLLEKARRLLPDNPTVCYHLALAYEARGQVQQAIALLRRASTLGDFPEAKKMRSLLTKLSG